MSRLIGLTGAGLLLAGCLSPGNPYYPELDTKAPTVRSVSPAVGGDAGVPTVMGNQLFVVTFSEPMDQNSLRPGIAVRDQSLQEHPLTITVDPIYAGNPTAADPDYDWPVNFTSADPNGFTPGVYQLLLRTLLIDQQGNPLAAEYTGTFQVQ